MTDEEDDDALWQRVTQSIKPLTGHREPLDPSFLTPPEEPAATVRPNRTRSRPGVTKAAPKPLEPGIAAGLDKRQAERFRRGLLAIEGRLDLHGLTQREAHAELEAFLERSSARRHRVILLITGKGQRAPLEERTSVLRRQVPRWLNEPSIRRHVVAFCHAHPKHGGDGAFYIYLKKTQ